jgi:hypothetical protein
MEQAQVRLEINYLESSISYCDYIVMKKDVYTMASRLSAMHSAKKLRKEVKELYKLLK